MSTIETIRRQLEHAERAWTDRRLREAVEGLQAAQDQILALAGAWIADRRAEVQAQVDRLAEVGLVVSDLDALLAAAADAREVVEAARLLEQVEERVQEMFDVSGKLLLRTNIFERGKKTFLAFQPHETLGDIGRRLKKRYRDQIVAHFEERGIHVAVPEALDIVFFGSLVWERPDEAVLSEHSLACEVAQAEPEGLIWFPVLPGDTPSLLGLEDDEDEASAMSILENFTVDACIDRIEDDVRRVAEQVVDPGGTASSVEEDPPGRPGCAVLVRAHGTGEEEHIPLVSKVVSLGRGRDTDIQIVNDARVSRHHCRIVREGPRYYIEDNGSSNGTTVDGHKVQRVELKGGEVIGIGDTTFIFQFE